MTSIPAANLDSAKFSEVEGHEFGYIRLVNGVLLLVVVIIAILLLFVARELHATTLAVNEAKAHPNYIRINSFGKAEVVYYRDNDYTPEAPEVVNALTLFTQDFFTRKKGRKEMYWSSKYLLSRDLQSRTWQEDQASKWIASVEAGGGIQSEASVDRVSLVRLDKTGGDVLVDYTNRFFQGEMPTDKTESWTARYHLIFTKQIDEVMLKHNPIGLIITDYSQQPNLIAR